MKSDRQVLVCQYVNCIANGSKEVLEAFQTYSVAGVEVVAVACQGQCNMGATVRILPDETWYCRVKSADVPEIVEQHLKRGELVDRLLHPRMHPRFGGGY
ncbi:MAG: (2Fe-2S) ferredoxin domain-containing protein [Leptolyngbyaceae cyanobacterium bins.302]|nr:(2Fe-2S) ferredoxin domain-containing protein [Leptolyngbyaceae cyanobacterium bins.302]